MNLFLNFRKRLSVLCMAMFVSSIVTAQTTITIPTANSDTGPGQPNNVVHRKPLGSTFGYERTQLVYRSTEISGVTGQNVTKVRFYVNSISTPAANTPIKIYLKNSSANTLSQTTFATALGTATLVYNGTVGSVTANAWKEFDVSASNFVYLGNTLEVLVEANATGTGNEGNTAKKFRHSDQGNGTNRMQYWQNDNSAPTGNGTLSQFRANVQFDFVSNSSCSGTPNAGTASGPADVCSGVSFTLTSAGLSTGPGITYQWQASTVSSGGPWSNIGGATNTTYTTSITAERWFKLVSACSNGGATNSSSVVHVALSPLYMCYCGGVNPTAICDEHIEKVIFNTINNNSVCGTGGYTDFFATQSTTLYVGSSFPVQVKNGQPYAGDETHVWIDYNQNGTFETTERIQLTPNNANNPINFFGNIAIPPTATLGTTRMRVRLNYDPSNADPGTPCGATANGETEDYKVIIATLPVNCTGTPLDGGTSSATPNTNACAGTTITLSASGPFTYGQNITYQWEVSTAGASGPFTDLVGVTGVAAQYTGQTQTSWYRMRTTCASSGLSAYTTVAQVTQDLATNCYCIPVSQNGNALHYISELSVNGYTRTSGTEANAFLFVTPSVTSFSIGSIYTANVRTGSAADGAAAIWLDYNADGDFDDANEFVGFANATNPFETVQIQFTIPAGVTLGSTRMRVRTKYSAGTPPGNWSPTQSCTDVGYGETEDYLVTLTSIAACNSMPLAGTAASSDASPCSGIPFTLSVTGSTSNVTGLTYQWFRNGIAIAGADQSTYDETINGIATNSYFRRIYCNATNDSAQTNTVTLTTTLCYCNATHAAPGASTGFYTDRFEIINGGIDNTSGASTTPYFTYFNALNPGGVQRGAPYWLHLVTGSNTGRYQYAIWIDYNQNGVFEASERVTSASADPEAVGAAENAYALVTVPNTATLGYTRLRIRIANANDATVPTVMDACATTYTSGETEDYVVEILPGSCVSATQAGFITSYSPTFSVNNDRFNATITGGNGTLIRWEFADEPTFTPVDATAIPTGPGSGSFKAMANGVPFYYVRAVFQNAACATDNSNVINIKLDCATNYTGSAEADYITDVTVEEAGNSIFSHNSTFDAVQPDNYQDFRQYSFSVSRAQVYEFTTTYAGANQFVAVWMDVNGDDELDATEILYNATSAAASHTFNVTIPCGTYVGEARLRIATNVGTAINANPCNASSYAYGEIQEYTVYINPLPSLTVTPPNAVCMGVQNTLTVNGGSNYTWSPSTGLNTTTGASVTAVTGGSAVFYTVTGTLPNGCPSSQIVAVASQPYGGTVIPVSTVVCNNGTKLFTVTGAAGNLQWQTSTNPFGPWTDVAGATNNTYTLSSITQTTYVRSISKTVLCWDVASTTGVVYVSSTPVITFTNLTNNSAIVSWSPYAAGQYNLSYTGAGTGNVSGASSPYTISGLTAGQPLLVTITQATPSCAGTSATTISTTTLCGKPVISSVTPVASASGVKGLKVQWSAVTGATAYRIYYRPLTMNANWSSADTSGGTQKTIMPLYGGVPYAVMVAANNCPIAGQLGQPSNVHYFTYTLPGTPACGPVPSITAVSSCPNQVTVNLAGGTGVWRVTARRLSPSFTGGVSYTVNSPVVNLAITAGANGSVWEVFAQSVCGSTYSGLSNVEIVTVKAPCAAPQNVLLSHPGCNGFTVSWNAAVCGGLILSNYQVYIKKSTAVNYVSYNGGSGDHKTFPYPALAPGTYTVFVRAITCNGSMSAASTVQTGVVGGPGCKTGDEETTEATEAVVAASIYPNPTAGQFSVEVTATSKNEALRIEVADALGRVVYTDLSDTEAGLPSLRVLNLPESMSAGLYTVRIAAGQNTWTERLVLQRD